MPNPIYLDYNATAPIRPQVGKAMLDSMAVVGNASSVHGFGRDARRQVERAREAVAQLINCRARDIIFTSSGTEANNHILKAWPERRLLVSAIEHDSVREVEAGRQIFLPVLPSGRLDVDQSLDILQSVAGPTVVAVMLVNNETGIIQPVEEFVRRVKHLQQDVHVHCDAVQAVGKMPLNFGALGVDSLSLSAHKFGGPQGVGALVHRPGLEIPRLLDGGGQERRLRAGTENVAGIVGLGTAAACCQRELEDGQQMSVLKDWRAQIAQRIQECAPKAVFLSEDSQHQLGTTINFALPGTRADTLVMKSDLNGLAISAGSACSSGKVNSSQVAVAMGYDQNVAQGSVRISIGWATTAEDIAQTLHILPKILG